MKYVFVIIVLLLMLLICFGCSESSNSGSAASPSPSSAPSVSAAPSEQQSVSPSPMPTVQELISSKALSRSDFIFMNSKNGEVFKDSSNMTIPSYVDIIGVSKQIDEHDIYFYIEVRQMPETLPINQTGLDNTMLLEYCWYISFDTNEDGLIDYNATFNHDRFWQSGEEQSEAPVDSSAFRTVVLQHEVRSDYTVAQGDFELSGSTLVFHIAKNGMEELTAITEDTPFCVFSENVTPDYYFCELVPRKQ